VQNKVEADRPPMTTERQEHRHRLLIFSTYYSINCKCVYTKAPQVSWYIHCLSCFSYQRLLFTFLVRTELVARILFRYLWIVVI